MKLSTFKGAALLVWILRTCSATIAPNNQLKVIHEWNQIGINYPNILSAIVAKSTGAFISKNNIPFGIEIWNDRLFITLPKLKSGVPVTLTTVPKSSASTSPQLTPYPNWNFYNSRNGCEKMTSVFRVAVDPCGRLWALDSGKTNVATKPTEVCPPQLFIFDLKDDSLLRRFTIPPNQILCDSLFTNIVVDYQGDCQDVYAYMTDSQRYTLVTYSFKKSTSWMITHGSFYPDPLSFDYKLDGLSWYWNYGISGMALGRTESNGDRNLYYHALSTYSEFSVPTSVLRDPGSLDQNRDKFVMLGQRGSSYSQAAGSALARNGVMFYGLIGHHIVGCWDTNSTQYRSEYQGIVGLDKSKISYPNDVKVDYEQDQSVWILSNSLPQYLSGTGDTNYVILSGQTDDAVYKTVCSPTFDVNSKKKGNNVATIDYQTTTVESVTQSGASGASAPTALTTDQGGDATLIAQTSPLPTPPQTTTPTITQPQTTPTTTTTPQTTQTTTLPPATEAPTTQPPQTTPTTQPPQTTPTTPPPQTTTQTQLPQSPTTTLPPVTEAPTTTAEANVSTARTPPTIPPIPTSASTSGATTQRAPSTTARTPLGNILSLGNGISNQLLQTGQNALEDCKDLPIGPESVRPCNILNGARNTGRRIIDGLAGLFGL